MKLIHKVSLKSETIHNCIYDTFGKIAKEHGVPDENISSIVKSAKSRYEHLGPDEHRHGIILEILKDELMKYFQNNSIHFPATQGLINKYEEAYVSESNNRNRPDSICGMGVEN